MSQQYPDASATAGSPTDTPHALQRALWRRQLSWLGLGLCCMAAPVGAQVQRSFINEGFELPKMTGDGCILETSSAQVPGWETTHPVMSGQTSCSSPANVSGPLIELWTTSTAANGIVSRQGTNFAELNAEVPSRLYQNICLMKGETIRWRFSHRGRLGLDVADLNVAGPVGSKQPVVQVGSYLNGTFNAPKTFSNSLVQQATVATPLPYRVGPTQTGWIDYSGSFVYEGDAGTGSLGFESVSAEGGRNSTGNLLDAIQIGITPFVDFQSASTSARESAGNNLPQLRINGSVTTFFDVKVRIVGGTAIGPGGASGTAQDYSTPDGSDMLTLRIPAGDYDGESAASLFALPVTIVKDAVAEPGKTIQFEIQEDSGASPGYLIASNKACGDVPVAQAEYTILDGGLELARAAAAPVPVAGSLSQYDVTYTIRAHNATGAVLAYDLSDALAADPAVGAVSVRSVSCSSMGSTSNCAGNLPASLPAGAGPWKLSQTHRTLENGAVDTYTLVVRFSILPVAGQRACAGAGTGLFGQATASVLDGEPASVQAHACVDTPASARIILHKQVASRVASTDQFQVMVTSGGTTAGTAATAGAAASASTAQIVLPAGAALQLSETLKANGSGPDQVPAGYSSELRCTNASAGSTTALPGGAGTANGSALQWPAIAPAAGDALDCTIVNTAKPPKLVVGLEASSELFEPGKTVNYVITVSNAGPVATTAPIQVTDTVSPGMTLGTLPAGCTATGQTVSCEIAAGLPGQLAGAVTARAGRAGRTGGAGEVSFTIPVTVTRTATSGSNTVQVWGGGDPVCTQASPCTASVSFSVPTPDAMPVPVGSRGMLALLGLMLAALSVLLLRGRPARRPE